MNELRSKLMASIDDINSGKLAPADARNIVGMANQINQSIHVELKAMTVKLEMGHKVEELGKLDIT